MPHRVPPALRGRSFDPGPDSDAAAPVWSAGLGRGVHALLAALIAAIALAHIALYLQPFEDSFITYRYARNLARGLGFVFNPGERVEGYTSFLWTVLLAGAAWLELPLLATSQLLSIACGLGVLALSARLARRMGASQGGPVRSSFELAAPLWLACTGTYAYYAMTGMETLLFTLLLTGACCMVLGEKTRRSHAAGAGVLLGLAAMARPEGVGYAVAFAFALCFGREGRVLAGLSLGCFTAVFAPYFAWRYGYFGYLAPNTYYAKASASGALWLQGVAHLEEVLLGRGFALPVVATLVAFARAPRLRALRLAAAMVVAALCNTLLVGGDIFLFFRFLLPAMPFAYAGLAGVLHRTAIRARHAQSRALWLASPALFAALVWSTELVAMPGLFRDRTHSEYERARANAEMVFDYIEVGRFLGEHARPGAWLATNAAGAVPYHAKLPTIDMLGLTDVHIAHRPIELGHGALGHEKHDAEYVLARKPDIVLLGLPALAPHHYRAGDMMRWLSRWLRFLPGDRAMLAHPDFARTYRPLHVRLSGGVLFAFARRDRDPFKAQQEKPHGHPGQHAGAAAGTPREAQPAPPAPPSGAGLAMRR